MPSGSTPRRPFSNRACDRCRRRKHKCDFDGTICTNCRDSGEECLFELPVARRGPKSRRSRPSDLNSSPSTVSFPEQSQVEIASPLQTPAIPLLGPTWESGPELSPQTVHSSLSNHGSTRLTSSLQRWVDLSTALSPAVSLDVIARKCFDVFFEYLFPLIPIVHEASLRDGLDFFIAREQLDTSSSISQRWTSYLRRGSVIEDTLDGASSLNYPEVWVESTFTLITALCAEAAFLLPKEIFPEGDLVADAFLQASRHCLNSYLEADLEHPNANSVAIRYFHSNCLHAAGKPKFSWHIFGEATRLAQAMQLHDESSNEGLFPVEAELRRRAFWIVYIGDKSAAILNSRPITIHNYSFESGITTAYPSSIEDDQSPLSPAGHQPAPDTAQRPSFIVGFNANLRLWQAAAELLLEMRLLPDQRTRQAIPHGPLSNEEVSIISRLYIRFITCFDDLPPYLSTEHFSSPSGRQTRAKQFLIQIANLQVSYHCLRMVITQKFEELNWFFPGLEQTDMLLLRKTEIARDMLRVIKEAPFWSLQVNGEPCVEKIRLIGASLLAIIHRNETTPLSSRARGDFTVLLDILTRLDSKASDALMSGSSLIL
ncbi:hypothetical protein V1522DRAFT_414078 [Lipomyces starkeyi]